MRDDPPKDHPPASPPGYRPARKKFAPLSGPERKAKIEPVPPWGESAAAAPQRVAKVIARAGACSRRDAEAWISAGRVALNGVVLTNPAVNVGDGDEIAIDGAPLAARARTRLFLFHKPRGLVTTERDPEGRQTIFDYLRQHWPDAPRLVSIGRLDINTEGLLLLTNDGGLARMLELPATGWVRRYRVRANGKTDQAVLDQLRRGVTVDGVAYAEIEATLDRAQGANCWLTMGLREGRNREIKRVLEHLSLEVNRLIRLSFGPFQLGELAEGGLEEVKTRVLRDQLGSALAAAAGVDFNGAAGDGSEAPAPPDAPRAGRGPARQVRASLAANDGPVHRARPARATGAPRNQRSFEGSPREPEVAARKKPAPGPRKHISALRGAAAEAGGGRKRTLRGDTADRSGRTVPVERLVAVERPARGARNGARRDARENTKPATRNARRFEAERKTRDGDAAPTPRAPGRPRAPSAARTARTPDSRRQGSRDEPGRGRSAETAGRNKGQAKTGGRADRPRGPYDAAKDRSRPDARRGPGGTPKRFDKPPRASGGQSGESTGTRGTRSGARPGKPRGPKFAVASGGATVSGGRGSKSNSYPKSAGAASGFRGTAKRPGGKGKPGGGPRRGPGAGRGSPPRDKP
jgi:23S rRNA pseudouridine2605 synthase